MERQRGDTWTATVTVDLPITVSSTDDESEVGVERSRSSTLGKCREPELEVRGHGQVMEKGGGKHGHGVVCTLEHGT